MRRCSSYCDSFRPEKWEEEVVAVVVAERRRRQRRSQAAGQQPAWVIFLHSRPGRGLCGSARQPSAEVTLHRGRLSRLPGCAAQRSTMDAWEWCSGQ